MYKNINFCFDEKQVDVLLEGLKNLNYDLEDVQDTKKELINKKNLFGYEFIIHVNNVPYGVDIDVFDRKVVVESGSFDGNDVMYLNLDDFDTGQEKEIMVGDVIHELIEMLNNDQLPIGDNHVC